MDETTVVPERTWGDWFKNQFSGTPMQYFMYFSGCVLFGLGVKLFIDANLGTDPLHAMIIGIVDTVNTPFLKIGFFESAITVTLLLVWTAWNRRFPPLMTFVTMALVGYLIDFFNLIQLQQYTTWLAPMPMMLAALLIDAYASALIIMSGIGIRIMDLVAITFVRKLAWKFVWAKLLFEISFVGIALVFGGPVGMGTVCFVIIVGTLIPPMIWANGRYMRLPNYGLSKKEGEPDYVMG
jgi:uncharacterized membrane protein YczE